jgi:hypothetical protein
MEGIYGLDVDSFKKLIANDELNCPEVEVFVAVRRYKHKLWNKLKSISLFDLVPEEI